MLQLIDKTKFLMNIRRKLIASADWKRILTIKEIL
jgi:hypothetical protein